MLTPPFAACAAHPGRRSPPGLERSASRGSARAFGGGRCSVAGFARPCSAGLIALRPFGRQRSLDVVPDPLSAGDTWMFAVRATTSLWLSARSLWSEAASVHDASCGANSFSVLSGTGSRWSSVASVISGCDRGRPRAYEYSLKGADASLSSIAQSVLVSIRTTPPISRWWALYGAAHVQPRRRAQVQLIVMHAEREIGGVRKEMSAASVQRTGVRDALRRSLVSMEG